MGLKVLQQEVCTAHGEIEGRVAALEEWRNGREEARVQDIQNFTDKLGEVHEKVNDLALTLAGLNGKIIGAIAAATTIAAIVGWALSQITGKGT